MNKQLGKLRKHAAGTCLHILKTLAFLPAERIFGPWNWVSSMVRVREEKSEFVVFSFELGAFAFFYARFASLSRALVLLCAREQGKIVGLYLWRKARLA
jgi:hypothetical protein